MNRLYQVLLGFVLGFIQIPGSIAQELITPLYSNPRAASFHEQVRSQKKSTADVLLEIPFFDDFSDSYVAPDTALWADKKAFVNNQYCIDPVSNGVATLDALDFDGSMYPHALIAPSTFVADQLTSHPIRLDYPASDSIYLSFLYQPQGRGDMPDLKDSLLVDFYDPALDSWSEVWGIPGDTLHGFTHALIPITESRFLTSGFQFRFRNLASLPRNNDYPDKRANVDHWNVDYVRLDRNRTGSDTLLRDVAFVSPLGSILKDLTAIPWSQFELAYNTILDEALVADYRNNDSITRNVTRSLTILEPYYNETYNPGAATAQDLPAFTDTSVSLGYIYAIDFDKGDSALIRYKAALRTDEFDPKVNDTVIHDQVFSDYWAYDDGSAEAGYGLRGQGTRNGSVAIKYKAYEPDLIGGVDVYFNQLYDSVNLDYFFQLMVWSESEGLPGPAIHEDEEDYTPTYTTGYPGLIRYHFSSPIAVDGVFYVGWRQYNEFMLNVGLDLNNRLAQQVMYYNFQGSWQASMAPGVMMLRPFLYNETTGVDRVRQAPVSLEVFPNPASERIYFNLPDQSSKPLLQITLFDTSGRIAHQGQILSDHMDVSHLPEGIYFVRANSGGTMYHAKVLINR